MLQITSQDTKSTIFQSSSLNFETQTLFANYEIREIAVGISNVCENDT